MSEIETRKITAVNRIERDGDIYNPGDTFECEAQEAERLIDLEAARLFVPEDQLEAGDGEGVNAASADVSAIALAKAEFIAAIEAAETYEEVLSLMPEEEPDPEIAAVFEKRLEELKEG